MQECKIVMYHYVRDLKNSRYPEIKGLDFQKFKRQIDYLKNRYHIIRIEELMEACEGGRMLPDNAMLLTFDDGYTDHFTNVFPILDEAGIQGSFYIVGKTFVERKLLDVNKIHFILASADIKRLYPDLLSRLEHYRGTEFSYPSNKELYEEFGVPNRFDSAEVNFVKRVLQRGIPEKVRSLICDELFESYVGVSEEKFAGELYMSEEQIACLKRHGMHIGVHSYHHYWLGKLAKEDMEQDMNRSLEALAPYIEKNNWSMNYPYGSEGAWNDETLAFLKRKGCKIAFTTKAETARIPACDPYLIPRYDTNDFPCDADTSPSL